MVRTQSCATVPLKLAVPRDFHYSRNLCLLIVFIFTQKVKKLLNNIIFRQTI